MTNEQLQEWLQEHKSPFGLTRSEMDEFVRLCSQKQEEERAMTHEQLKKLSQMYWESMYSNERLLPPDIARKGKKRKQAYCDGYYDAIAQVLDVLDVEPLRPDWWGMSPSDQEEQRRSFAYGNTKIDNDDITRKIVDEVAEQEPAKLTIEDLRVMRDQLRKYKSPSGILYPINPSSCSKLLAKLEEIEGKK